MNLDNIPEAQRLAVEVKDLKEEMERTKEGQIPYFYTQFISEKLRIQVIKEAKKKVALRIKQIEIEIEEL